MVSAILQLPVGRAPVLFFLSTAEPWPGWRVCPGWCLPLSACQGSATSQTSTLCSHQTGPFQLFSSSFPALPCPLPRLWFPALLVVSVPWSKAEKADNLAFFFLLLCNLKLNMDLGLPWLVLELPLSYFGTVSHQCSRLPCV